MIRSCIGNEDRVIAGDQLYLRHYPRVIGRHLGGLIGLTYLTYKAWTGAYTPQSAVSIEYFGLYWHFVDLIWVLVFPFFYLY